MLAKVANLQTNVSHSVVAGEVKCVKCGRVMEWMNMEQRTDGAKRNTRTETSLCSSQILHGVSWGRTGAPAVSSL
jgi:hypothetical protein